MDPSHTNQTHPGAGTAVATPVERRGTPRRRLRDRIASLDRTQNPSLRGGPELANMVLLVEDDLREAALAMGRIEHSLSEALAVLEQEGVTAQQVLATVDDLDPRDRVEHLSDSLDNLRHHLHRIASLLK